MGNSRRKSEKHSEDSQGNKNVESESNFSEEEVDLIGRLYKLLGERWSLIAGRIPGRTAEEIEKYWMKRNSND